MSEGTATQTPAPPPVSNQNTILNVPNQVTITRIILALVCFVALVASWYLTAFILFLLAAGTDWIDGYWARRYGQITKLGRILDPFADKIVICGVFIFLAAVPVSGVAPWMAVVIVARELMVTGLRSFFEQEGVDFSARWAGKWKMILQCVAGACCLYRLTYLDTEAGIWRVAPPIWMNWLVVASVWLAVLSTVYSGWEYVQFAYGLLRKKRTE